MMKLQHINKLGGKVLKIKALPPLFLPVLVNIREHYASRINVKV